MLNWGATLGYIDRILAIPEVNDNDTHASTEDLIHTSYDLDVQRDSVTVSNQQLDYIFRSREIFFDQLCLYDFISHVNKAVIPSKMKDTVPAEDIKGAFSSWHHPQRSTHRLLIRQCARVPVLLGPSIPNPNRSSDVKEVWAKYVLALFKPWRDPRDLKRGHNSWLSAYEVFEAQLSDRHREIIEHMNVFAESSDDHAHSRPGGRVMADASLDVMALSGEIGDNVNLENHYDCDEEDVNDASKLSLPTDPFVSLQNPAGGVSAIDIQLAQKLGPEIIPCIDSCQGVVVANEPLDDDNSFIKRVTSSDMPQISKHRAYMDEQRRKRTYIPKTNESNAERGHLSMQIRTRRHEPVSSVMHLENFEGGPPIGNLIPRVICIEDIVNGVIDRMNLASNPEQLQAFRTVSNHLLNDEQKQLLMYVSGVGGTGKSHVIKAIVSLFEALGCRNQLLLSAPTGIAAVLIGGHTLHSLALINPKGPPVKNNALVEIWKDVRYLIIDEVSMVGAELLSQFSNRLRDAKSGYDTDISRPFGGVNVIFMGDFGQLKPPVQHSLYSHVIIRQANFVTASSLDGISAMNGVLLWRQVSTVVELVKNQRHMHDAAYSDFLQRLRRGACVASVRYRGLSDLDYIRSRLLTNLSKEELAHFRDAPFIVGSKSLRDILNAKLIMYHAKRTNAAVHLYHSIDTVSRASVPIGVRNMLWNLNSSKNREAFGRLPLFVSMKVMVTENIAFGGGIVNGTEGIVELIYYNEDKLGIRFPTAVYIRVNGCKFNLPGADPDVVPIFPVSTRINHAFSLNDEVSCTGFTRKQLPLVPGYAYTDFKSQGRTLERALVDIVTSRGQGVYVMLSRVRCLSGVAVIRWFPSTKIYSRLSAELRDELERINNLVAVYKEVLRE